MPHSDRASAPLPTLPFVDPAIGEVLELRLLLARISIPPALPPERLEEARNTLRAIGRSANLAIRAADVRRSEDVFANACFAARSQVGDAREILASANFDTADLARARRALYRGLCLVAEALAAASPAHTRSARASTRPIPRRGVLFAAFVTQVVAATRTNPKDAAWALEVADAEIGVAVAHPDFASVSTEQRGLLRSLRGEMAAWAAGERSAEAGYALLNRLVLLVDCLNH